jgi:zinc/manganese transport system permease protein
VAQVLRAIVEPGFFASSPVRLALAVGGVVALVAGTVGVFTVLRGQSFAGEALGDIGSAGGSSAYLAGVAPLWGFVGIAVAAAGVMELIGVQRARGRDLATGIVLGAGFGLAALFLYLGTTYDNTTGATVTILFGSIFTLDTSILPLVLGLGVVALAIVAVLYRPLLLASVSLDLAAARRLPVRLIGSLVGPAATALHLTRRPGRAIAVAGAVGLAATWLGILLAYDSYRWPPLRHGWPVSFFVVTLVLIAHVVTRVARRR